MCRLDLRTQIECGSALRQFLNRIPHISFLSGQPSKTSDAIVFTRYMTSHPRGRPIVAGTQHPLTILPRKASVPPPEGHEGSCSDIVTVHLIVRP